MGDGDKKKEKVSAEDLEVEGSRDVSYVTIAGLKIKLARPYELNFEWIGSKKVVNQLLAAWYCSHKGEKPMSPRLVGKPGVGKTAMAYAAGKKLGKEVYFFQATSDTQPNDLLINPVIVETSKDTSRVEYVASSLVTAIVKGGVCVLDEGNRMQEKAWASLAPLLDSRKYVESVATGLLVKAHPEFRFVCTMNDDASCFDLPEYIQSRMHPYISLDFPERGDERKILEVNLPYANPTILDYVADFITLARREGENYSSRDGIHIADYAGKLMSYFGELGQELEPSDSVITAVEQILGIRQARYIKKILWAEQAA